MAKATNLIWYYRSYYAPIASSAFFYLSPDPVLSSSLNLNLDCNLIPTSIPNLKLAQFLEGDWRGKRVGLWSVHTRLSNAVDVQWIGWAQGVVSSGRWFICRIGWFHKVGGESIN